jgi:type II secretory pathway component PulF
MAADLRFAWRGVDANGAGKRGRTIAADAASARAALRREGRCWNSTHSATRRRRRRAAPT